MKDAPIMENGNFDLGRRATLWHAEFGSMDRIGGGTQTARFELTDTPDEGEDRIIAEYSVETFREEWEESIFESPVHVDDVRRAEAQDGDGA